MWVHLLIWMPVAAIQASHCTGFASARGTVDQNGKFPLVDRINDLFSETLIDLPPIGAASPRREFSSRCCEAAEVGRQCRPGLFWWWCFRA